YDKQENVSHAIVLFEEAQKLDSNYAQAYAGLGEAYWRKYNQTKSSEWIDAALKHCQTSLEKKPQFAAGHGCLGIVYAGTGRYQEAIDEYEKALRIEPVNDDFRRQRARAEERIGKLQEAEAIYHEAIKLRPHYWANY